MNIIALIDACNVLGISDYNIEPDGVIWTGTNDNRTNLTNAQQKAVHAKATAAETGRAAAKTALLNKLGITADEAALLLG